MKKISYKVRDEVAAKAAEGWGPAKIAEWLETSRGIKVTRQAVSKMLTTTRTERADIAKVVVRETLGKSIPADLARLEKLAQKAEELAEGAEDDAALWVKLADQVRKITETKLHFSGADTPDDSLSELAAAAERIRQKLAAS